MRVVDGVVRPAVHFVGFKGYEYVSAVRVFGPPGFVHIKWDRRAHREIAEGDLVVFAQGEWTQAPLEKSYADTLECSRLNYLSELAGAAIAEQWGTGVE